MTGHVVCCVLCGLTGIDLPDDHGCRPNLPAFYDLFNGRGGTGKDYFAPLRHRPRQATQPVDVSPQGRFAGVLRTVSTAVEGERNTKLHWAACRAGEMVVEGTLDPWQAAEALAVAGTSVGLEPREVAATIRSGFSTSGVVV